MSQWNIWKILKSGAGEEWRKSLGPSVWKVERNILLTIKRSKANWIGHNWRRKCLLKHAIEGKIEGSKEVTGRGGIRRKHLLGDLEGTRGFWKLKRGSTRSYCVENWLWKRLWTCLKTDFGMNELMNELISESRLWCSETVWWIYCSCLFCVMQQMHRYIVLHLLFCTLCFYVWK